MSNLKYRQEKIQAKRKQTPRRQFVKEICSWRPLSFYGGKEGIQKFPNSPRKGSVLPVKEYITIDFGAYARDYDGARNFFGQYGELFRNASKSTVFHYFDNENCNYADQVHASKNGYLSVGVTGGCDTVLYSFFSKESKNILNSICSIDYSENVYQSSGAYRGYNIFYSRFTFDSSYIRFSSNLQGCSECIFCDDLENQSYCIHNTQYTKEEYLKKKKDILSDKHLFEGWYDEVVKVAVNRGSVDSTGNFIINSNNVESSLYAYKISHGRNIAFGGGSGTYENLYDIFTGGGCADHYAVIFSGGKSQHIYCSIDIGACSNMYYCMYCLDSSFCIGCIGLQNKSFCIFNKQYTKEEWYEKANEVFAQMEQDGTLGEFFPGSMNPFYFNDTAAYLMESDFTKAEIEGEGYLRRTESMKVDVPEGVEAVKVSDLGGYEGWTVDGERKIDSSILKKVIQDEEGNVYRIVKMEYEFLVKHGLPLPRKHWLERLKMGFEVV